LKTSSLRFGVDGKHFENDDHVIFLPEFSSNTNPKCPVIVVLSNFSGAV